MLLFGCFDTVTIAIVTWWYGYWTQLWSLLDAIGTFGAQIKKVCGRGKKDYFFVCSCFMLEMHNTSRLRTNNCICTHRQTHTHTHTDTQTHTHNPPPTRTDTHTHMNLLSSFFCLVLEMQNTSRVRTNNWKSTSPDVRRIPSSPPA